MSLLKEKGGTTDEKGKRTNNNNEVSDKKHMTKSRVYLDIKDVCYSGYY
ncbi:hypothetical protein AGMMS49574_30210 [Bacteroidia bacterium]|nr:hypothetical protein AGMMS49574_30210 [Bacteroidia bacterium]GHU58177.1 hypothetical protein FACS189411_13150 [Bacteroidia bacterium]GHV06887.1 hypothetical protein FACS189416_7600 [Bacteroidia bacterium]